MNCTIISILFCYVLHATTTTLTEDVWDLLKTVELL